MKDGKYGYRTMYLKDNSLFFIETVIYLMRNLFKTIVTHAEKNILVMAALQLENSRNGPSLLKNEYERDEFLLVGLCQF